ncbi:hypothetical protein CHS0354_036513 [Potamilus streckersoni]|uniref:Uncharacterized protein n=1 Tax=Potamilus streckersoni TaxID=2493646 RepID=A0AAE0S8F3_9BIVA|nr:hypothetical protein CHS0354_036513 [Potamilus streckersoni]
MDETTYAETDSENTIPLINVMQDATEICHLAHIARLWAQEAEIRARYSLTFAEKAISEASSSHNVAESLARTSKMVASLALDLANRMELGSDMCDDEYDFVDRNMDEDSLFEYFRHARGHDMYVFGNNRVKPDDNIEDKEDSLLSKSQKFTETFPKYTISNLSAEFDSLSTLAPIYEQGGDDLTWANRPNKAEKWQEAKNIKKLQRDMESIKPMRNEYPNVNGDKDSTWMYLNKTFYPSNPLASASPLTILWYTTGKMLDPNVWYNVN